MKIDKEKLKELAEKYPIGSKLLATNLKGDHGKVYVCKVIGYSTFTYRVLVYNPEIKGIFGNILCVDDLGETIPKPKYDAMYQDHCALVADRNTSYGKIVRI